MADYRKNYEDDSEAAIDFLTQVIENQTRQLIVDATDVTQDHLAGKIETILNNDSDKTLSTNDLFIQSKNVVLFLKSLQNADNQSYIAIENQVKNYFNQLKNYKISDLSLLEVKNSLSCISTLLYLLIAFPLFLYGLIFNLIPYLITELIWQKLKLEAYEATVRIGAGGLVVFPLCYWASLHFVENWLHFPFFGIFFWIINIILGIFAWNYAEKCQFCFQVFKTKQLDVKVQEMLLEQRTEILKNIRLKS